MTETKTNCLLGDPAFELTDLVTGVRQMICCHCGRSQSLTMPQTVGSLTFAVRLFTLLHRYCDRPEPATVH